ncbi:hypothetical protein MJA45_13825 [Paenibacillus aurantius]|uniref:Uncharacterized protein n=1 Tax=Paenibacillus aurantius TaxID=2918900 RepID=A0AA96LH70_9BACL|nr:hypothetical protein [Paenibacillus aurantius]WNQ14049.1 hypothetical protein MJA45_13825 [Paenibacillus aurantius]
MNSREARGPQLKKSEVLRMLEEQIAMEKKSLKEKGSEQEATPALEKSLSSYETVANSRQSTYPVGNAEELDEYLMDQDRKTIPYSLIKADVKVATSPKKEEK